MHRPVLDRTHAQAAFEGVPRFLDPLQLLVPQSQLGWTQAVLVAMHHKFAVELFFRAPFGRVNPQQPSLAQAQIAPIAPTGPQLPPPLAVALTPDFLERSPLGLKFTQNLLAERPLAFFLVGIVAHDIAPAALALPYHHFLHSQVVRHLLKTPWALEDVMGDRVPASHRHPDDVFAPARAEPIEVILGDHPRIAHKDAPAQLPPL